MSTLTRLRRIKYFRVIETYFSVIFDIAVMRPLIWGVGHFCRSSCKIWVLHEIKKQFWVHTIRFFTFSGKNESPSENTKNPILKRLICIQCQNVIFGLWRPENGKRNYFQVQTKYFQVQGIRFFEFCGLQRPKMTPNQKTQKPWFWKDFCI